MLLLSHQPHHGVVRAPCHRRFVATSSRRVVVAQSSSKKRFYVVAPDDDDDHWKEPKNCQDEDDCIDCEVTMKRTTRAAGAKDKDVHVGDKNVSDLFEKIVQILTDERQTAEANRKKTIKLFRDTVREIAGRERRLLKKCLKKSDDDCDDYHDMDAEDEDDDDDKDVSSTP